MSVACLLLFPVWKWVFLGFPSLSFPSLCSWSLMHTFSCSAVVKSCRAHGLGQLTRERASECGCSHSGLLWAHCHGDRKARVSLPDRRTCSVLSFALWGRWVKRSKFMKKWSLEVEFYFPLVMLMWLHYFLDRVSLHRGWVLLFITWKETFSRQHCKHPFAKVKVGPLKHKSRLP